MSEETFSFLFCPFSVLEVWCPGRNSQRENIVKHQCPSGKSKNMRLGMHERKNLYVRATMKRRKKKKKIAPRDFMISRLQFSNLRKSDFINFSYPNQMLGSGHRRASIRLYEGPWVPGSKMCVSKYNCAMHMFSGLGSFISLGLGCLSNPSFYYPGVEGSKGSLKTHYSCWTCRNVGVTSRPRHHIPH